MDIDRFQEQESSKNQAAFVGRVELHQFSNSCPVSGTAQGAFSYGKSNSASEVSF
jgi:hypothetical protein